MAVKRMISVEKPVAIVAAGLDEAVRVAHDIHGWHYLDAAEELPSYAPAAASGWLVRGRRVAFLCADRAGWYIFEYVAGPVDG